MTNAYALTCRFLCLSPPHPPPQASQKRNRNPRAISAFSNGKVQTRNFTAKLAENIAEKSVRFFGAQNANRSIAAFSQNRGEFGTLSRTAGVEYYCWHAVSRRPTISEVVAQERGAHESQMLNQKRHDRLYMYGPHPCKTMVCTPQNHVSQLQTHPNSHSPV